MANKEYWILREHQMDKADLEANMETANAEGWELEQFTVDPNNCYVAVMVRSKEEPKIEQKPDYVVLPDQLPKSRPVVCRNPDCKMYDEAYFYCMTEWCPECKEDSLQEWDKPKDKIVRGRYGKPLVGTVWA